MAKEPFKTYDWGKGNIDISTLGPVDIMRPTELHLKRDGDIKGNPSFCIVMESPIQKPVAGEISLRMLNEGLNKLGLEIKPISL